MTTVTTLTKCQRKTFGPRPIAGWGKGAVITATVRFDDECGNGHNTFSVTAEIRRPGERDIEAGGCLHDEVARAFPELAPLIKWHLCSTDGPLHYVANTTYHASDRDCWGLRAGEFRQTVSRQTGLPLWEPDVPDDWKPWAPSVAAAEPPPPVTVGWKPVGRTGEGKARDLDAARRAAVWPDATDDELTAPGLEERLKARLPALLAEFRAAVESLGFTW